ncbi:MAG: class I SAM-dependent methyltransferase [Anaerovoracaceae bacterium]|jgi:ubiquinone/menaquinone biosynthesis C-methylase UbiE
MLHKDYDYDEIADKIFFPIYGVIADSIIEKTQITDGQLIDIGCGGGHLGLTLMQKTNLKGTLVDIKDAAIEIALQRAKEWGLADRVDATVQDVHNMEFDDGFADLIISRGSMIFWEDQEKAFREIYRVLAPGGRTYIGTGLGNTAVREQIRAKMKKKDPNWPKNIHKNSKALSTDQYKKMFSDWGLDFEIIDNKDQGRWIILKK